jgi:hypothetical protein
VSLALVALIAWTVNAAAPLMLQAQADAYDPGDSGQVLEASWINGAGITGDQGLVLSMASTVPYPPGASADNTILGVDGISLTALGFDHKIGTACTGGSPRWSIETTEGGSFAFGCSSGTHTDLGNGWERITFSDADVQSLSGDAWPGFDGDAMLSFLQVLQDEAGSTTLDNLVVGLDDETVVFTNDSKLRIAAKTDSLAPGQNKLICFDGTTDGGYNGVCTLTSNGAKGPATLNNNDTDAYPYNNYSGVYVANSSLYNSSLSAIKQLSFEYSGEATAGSPRVSIPVDTNGDETSDGYLFVSAYYCNDGAGLVDIVNDPTCTIYTNFSAESFDNWADLIATHPTWRIVNDAYVFLIADDPGVWTVKNVKFGKAGN